MFDAVLNRANISTSRFGTGAIFSVALHAGLIALIFWESTQEPAVTNRTDLTVRFIKSPSLPPPPPPKLGTLTLRTPRAEHKQLRKPDVLIQPKEVPKERPSEAEPEPEARDTQSDHEKPSAEGVEGEPGGVPGGQLGGVVGGESGGTPGGQLGSGVLPFGEGMSRPVQTWGQPPKYTREALAAQVQGNMLVKCVITIDGKLENCRIIKPVPHMEKAVLDALSTWRYKPVHFQGKPVPVDYLIQIKLVIPH